MFSGYYYKIVDSWTPPLLHAPRWFSANAYPTLTDDVAIPPVTEDLLSGPPDRNYTTPSGPYIPDEWIFPTSTAALSGNLMQRFWEVFTNEKEYFNPQLTSVYMQRAFYFDIAEPQFAWIIESQLPIESLEVAIDDNSWVEITKAQDDLELFYSGDWKYKQDGNIVLIYGLDIQYQDTESRVDDWLWVQNPAFWSSGSIFWVEHPNTRNRYPIHPSTIRQEDTFLGLIGSACEVRFNYPQAALDLDTIYIKINGNVTTARRVNLVNSVDEKGLWFGLQRKDGETNETFADAILNASWFGNQTYHGVRDWLSAALRTGTKTTVAVTASGFTFPASATGYSIRNINQYAYVSEFLSPDQSSSSGFRTIYNDPQIGCAELRGIVTSFASNTSGVIEFDEYTNNQVDLPLLNWRLKYWTEAASSVVLTDNFPTNVPDLIVFFPSKVRVNSPSTQTLKKSFNRTSPKFRWQSYIPPDQPEPVKGLAEFDF